VLLYGCRSAGRDLLFNGEVQEMMGLGVLSQALVAFSREAGQPRTYVQVGVLVQQVLQVRRVWYWSFVSTQGE
jgi:sulfite reductase alpha subunit-like flavoprotein